MHDIRRLREHGEDIRRTLSRKGFEADIDQILELDQSWRELVTMGNELKSELNRTSRAIGEAKKAGRDAKVEVDEARRVRENIAEIDKKKRSAEQTVYEALLTWPAEPDVSVPDGLTEQENVVVKECENPPEYDFKLVDHLTLAESLGILDMSRGAKVTGSAWPVYVGAGAALERALINFMLDLHTREHGYRELFVPFVVNQKSVLGTGQLPKLEDDMYRIERENFYLIPTAEVPITNLYRDEIIEADVLPLRYAAYSACFRREAGAYGADTRGLMRVHQFNKVELVQIVPPEMSGKVHEEILNQATRVLDLLEIPYRVVELCAGGLSFAAAKCYDIEVWSPATNNWLEASSISNFKEFQARRMNMRYRPAQGVKPVHPHTLNGSGVATSRLMVSLLETYQTPEARIRIPRVLRPYLDSLDQIRGNNL